MNVLGTRLDPPRGEGFRRQTGLKPIGEGLRSRKVGIFGNLGAGRRESHIRDSEEPARIKREREFWDKSNGGNGFGGRNEIKKRKGGEDEVRE